MTAFTQGGFIAMQLGGIALFVSIAVTGFTRLGGLGDVPIHRSSHNRTTPTAGGLGVIAGVGAALFAGALLHSDFLFSASGDAARMASLLALIFAVAMVGLIDDRFVLPAKPKLLLLLLLSQLMALTIGLIMRLPISGGSLELFWLAGLVGTTLWVFVTINSVNFIDGIDGLMGLSMAVASGALCGVAVRAGAPQAALLSGTLCAALLGFLVYNAPPRARIFSGDCGALFIGALYAAASLMLVRERPDMPLLYVGPLLILPVLTDVLMTLIAKPFHKIPILAAHRMHLFQRLSRLTKSHLFVTLLYATLGTGLAQLAFLAQANGTIGSMKGFALMIAMFIALYWLVSILLPKDI